MMGGMTMYGGHGFFVGGFMWIFWILLVLVIVWAVKAGISSGSNDGPRETRTPLKILKERYAKGEIDKETFERMKRDLG
ncbi:MAG: SHOCT domain-containing protein [Gammaproteobacteria bacterium]|nr:MAG: SHOCT domain-containing protein [Gammaproteobacteria bacterium]